MVPLKGPLTAFRVEGLRVLGSGCSSSKLESSKELKNGASAMSFRDKACPEKLD